jgi:hypothetical protein
MAAMFNLALVIAQSGPRDDNPSEGGGILIIVGVILAVVLVVAAGVVLVNRFGVRQRVSRRPKQGDGVGDRARS